MPAKHYVLGTPLKGPFPEGVETAIFGMGCFWGAERLFWEAARRLHDRRRLRGRLHAQPHLRGGLLRTHRPRRGRARRLRHVSDQLRGDAEAVLGGPRPDPGHAPGQRRRHPVPLGDPLARTRPSALAAEASSDAYQQMLTQAATARSRPRSSRPARSTTPRTTTSSTSPRTPAATAASAAPASAARSALARQRLAWTHPHAATPLAAGRPELTLRCRQAWRPRDAPSRNGSDPAEAGPLNRSLPAGTRPEGRRAQAERTSGSCLCASRRWVRAAMPARADRRASARPRGRPRCRGSRDRRSRAPRRTGAAARRSRPASAG